jgi:hypothetical protein
VFVASHYATPTAPLRVDQRGAYIGTAHKERLPAPAPLDRTYVRWAKQYPQLLTRGAVCVSAPSVAAERLRAVSLMVGTAEWRTARQRTWKLIGLQTNNKYRTMYNHIALLFLLRSSQAEVSEIYKARTVPATKL